jgi:hypothetical protein
LEKTIQILNELEDAGVIEKYAIGGAVAAIFYIESTVTFDLDIFVLLKKEKKSLISLSPIYNWFESKGCEFEIEHIIIEGIPVKFISAYNELVEEAVNNSVERTYKNVKTKVINPEYLIAIMIDTFRAKDKERVIRFFEEFDVNPEALDSILTKYDLTDKFKRLKN